MFCNSNHSVIQTITSIVSNSEVKDPVTVNIDEIQVLDTYIEHKDKDNVTGCAESDSVDLIQL